MSNVTLIITQVLSTLVQDLAAEPHQAGSLDDRQ
jgi:hypothetical protein